MSEPRSHSERRTRVDHHQPEVSLFAEELDLAAKIRTALEHFEDGNGHGRIFPPTDLNESQIEELGGTIAERCMDIRVDPPSFCVRLSTNRMRMRVG
jgi:hypothetical protein